MKKIVWILIIALTLMGCNSDPTKKVLMMKDCIFFLQHH